ncbi:MAG: NAD-glutamate dehydrogenase, partial [Geminicoccaceae bacterium]|nr:NAD-glutamate dehydrogenase [Geminicoccaceae bacterium]
MRKEDRKLELLDQLRAMIRTKLDGAQADIADRFVASFFRDVAPSDLVDRELLDLYGTALAQLRFAGDRTPGTPKIRVYNPKIEQHGWQSTHTVVEIVNDDMPFLVDSVSNELSRHGLGIHLIIHPVLLVRRGADGKLIDIVDQPGEGVRAESMMHLEIDRQSDQSVLEEVEASLAAVLEDVRFAVEDWQAMRERIADAIEETQPARDLVDAEDFEECKAFLTWLADDHFTLLGYSSYRLEGDGDAVQLRRVKGSGLGILRGKDDGALSESFKAMPLAARRRAREPMPLVSVAKAHTRSTVHRSTYLDFVGVRTFADDGTVIGENRFLGLFTSAAYNRSPRVIPLLRHKIDYVVDKSGLSPSGHAGKALVNILETYPRDELFQSSRDQLARIAFEILQLQDRQHIRLFVRRDNYERFVSCLVYVPRERYTTALRTRMEAILGKALESDEIDFQAQVSESMLARVLFTVRTPKGIPEDLDVEAIERELVDTSYSWTDRLKQALLDTVGEEEGNRLYRAYGQAFPISYQENQAARAAVPDIKALAALQDDRAHGLAMSLYRRLEDPLDVVRFKLIHPDSPIYLADALPILENMGLRVLQEEPHQLRARDDRFFSMHDFNMKPTVGEGPIDVDAVRDDFQDAFERIWRGKVENDGFNRLVLAAGLSAREIVVLRAYCKYMLQIGSPFSQAYIERTFTSNPGIAAEVAALFDARFDPDLEADRAARVKAIEERIGEKLEQVAILDEDRILRRYLGLMEATLRTNAFQRGEDGEHKPYLSLKFDPARVPGMPLPKPAYEIFVYAPDVEGVHLRGGKVARGGLRW